jgi:hypothetical protein
MQTPAAAELPPDRPLARVSVGLTALLGEVDVFEDELLGKLRAGLSSVLARGEARPAFHADVALAAVVGRCGLTPCLPRSGCPRSNALGSALVATR